MESPQFASPQPASLPKPARLISLDFLRGLTVASMILVNNPGDWGHIYPPLEHSVWNGCTPTDLVFPFFLYIVGVSINYAIGDKRLNPGLHNKLIENAARRSAMIFGLAMILSLIMHRFDFTHLRILGVLPRIAIVFFLCALLFIKTSRRFQITLFFSILVIYCVLMTLVPVPGFGPSNLLPGTNLAAWVDYHILGPNHMWAQSKTWDPEGILSTLPSISTCLFGVLTGGFLKRKDLPDANKVAWLFSMATLSVIAGLCWDLFFPMNKALWTSSFVLFTGGLATAGLALSYWLIDVQDRKKYTAPFLAFGANAITIYVVSGYLPIVLNLIKIHTAQGLQGLPQFLYNTLFTPWLSPVNASLASALTYVILLTFPMLWMYKRKIFIKI
ncbi:MAG TPA: heparan-alpha-glucosaminide N-acetyltransferase domain-containing protein [Puia sp.]|nr:heparan-alpha-glucosaminide N-acetyltransferase domain-containing protein [Puia sp.]